MRRVVYHLNPQAHSATPEVKNHSNLRIAISSSIQHRASEAAVAHVLNDYAGRRSSRISGLETQD